MSDELEGTRHAKEWMGDIDAKPGQFIKSENDWHSKVEEELLDYDIRDKDAPPRKYDGDQNKISIYNGPDLSKPARGIVPYDPKPDQVTLESLAHAMGFTARFAGHTRFFYSVAQHSLYVAAHVPQDQRLRALLHDASEAYLTDIPSPYKMQIPGYKRVEARVTNAIGKHFGITNLAVKSPEVRAADYRALGHEANSFMPTNGDWYGDYYRTAIEETKHLPPIETFETSLFGETMDIAKSMSAAAYSIEEFKQAVRYEIARRDGDFKVIGELNAKVKAIYEKYHYPEPETTCEKCRTA